MKMTPIVIVVPDSARPRLDEYVKKSVAMTMAESPDAYARIEEMCARNGWTIDAMVAGVLLAKAVREVTQP